MSEQDAAVERVKMAAMAGPIRTWLADVFDGTTKSVDDTFAQADKWDAELTEFKRGNLMWFNEAKKASESAQTAQEALRYEKDAHREMSAVAADRTAELLRTEAELTAARKAGRIEAYSKLDAEHACCTIGCGAMEPDGPDARTCPTCLLAEKFLAEESTALTETPA